MSETLAGHGRDMAQDKQGLRALTLLVAGAVVVLVVFWLVWQYAAE